MNLGTYLDQKVERYSSKPLLYFYDDAMTYAEFGERVDRLAFGLKDQGFEKGDFIHVWMQNSPETLISYFAIQKIGAIAGPINGQWKADEVRYLLNDSRGRGLIVGARYLPVLDEVRDDCPDLEKVIEVGDTPRARHVSYAGLLAEGSSDRMACTAAETDPAYIFYTSGTTGNPKGVLLSHRNVFADV